MASRRYKIKEVLTKDTIEKWAEIDPEYFIVCLEKIVDKPLLKYQKDYIYSMHNACKNYLEKNDI